MSVEYIEFVNVNGSIIRVRPHDVCEHDYDKRVRAMTDLLVEDIMNVRYNEYRIVLAIKLYTKCLNHNRPDLCLDLGSMLGTMLTSHPILVSNPPPTPSPAEPDLKFEYL